MCLVEVLRCDLRYRLLQTMNYMYIHVVCLHPSLYAKGL
jgi:hypothetical protein